MKGPHRITARKWRNIGSICCSDSAFKKCYSSNSTCCTEALNIFRKDSFPFAVNQWLLPQRGGQCVLRWPTWRPPDMAVPTVSGSLFHQFSQLFLWATIDLLIEPGQDAANLPAGPSEPDVVFLDVFGWFTSRDAQAGPHTYLSESWVSSLFVSVLW